MSGVVVATPHTVDAAVCAPGTETKPVIGMIAMSAFVVRPGQTS
ncbi:MAG: hypothetical protein AAB131_04305 [Actinomycetota bacterium]